MSEYRFSLSRNLQHNDRTYDCGKTGQRKPIFWYILHSVSLRMIKSNRGYQMGIEIKLEM